MIRLRYDVETYDPNGDDVRVAVQVDTVLDQAIAAAAAHAAILEGLRAVGAITEPGPER